MGSKTQIFCKIILIFLTGLLAGSTPLLASPESKKLALITDSGTRIPKESLFFINFDAPPINHYSHEIVVRQSIPKSVGIETYGEVMTRMISKNTPCHYRPARKSRTFTTYSDNQTSVEIKVYAGECRFTRDCHEVGRFELSGITRSQWGMIQIVVTLVYNEYGRLQVTAEDKPSQNRQTILINDIRTREEIDQFRKEMAEWIKEMKEDSRIYSRTELETYISNMQNTIRNEEQQGINKIDSNEKEKIGDALKDASKWLEENQFAMKVVFDEKMKELKDICLVIEKPYMDVPKKQAYM